MMDLKAFGLIVVHHDIKVGGPKFEPYLHSTFHLKVKNQRLGPVH